MAKNVIMTRERKIAFPVVLTAARAAFEQVQMTGKQREELRQALEAFRES